MYFPPKALPRVPRLVQRDRRRARGGRHRGPDRGQDVGAEVAVVALSAPLDDLHEQREGGRGLADDVAVAAAEELADRRGHRVPVRDGNGRSHQPGQHVLHELGPTGALHNQRVSANSITLQTNLTNFNAFIQLQLL